MIHASNAQCTVVTTPWYPGYNGTCMGTCNTQARHTEAQQVPDPRLPMARTKQKPRLSGPACGHPIPRMQMAAPTGISRVRVVAPIAPPRPSARIDPQMRAPTDISRVRAVAPIAPPRPSARIAPPRPPFVVQWLVPKTRKRTRQEQRSVSLALAEYNMWYRRSGVIDQAGEGGDRVVSDDEDWL